MTKPDAGGDMRLGSLCRTGLLLCLSFWVPAGALLGVIDLAGYGTSVWFGVEVPSILAIPAGMASGFAIAVLNDAALAIGAVLLVLVRKVLHASRS